MKQEKGTCKQILNRQSSLPDFIRLQAVAWLSFWRRCCACVLGLLPFSLPPSLSLYPSLVLLVPEQQIENFGVGLLLLGVAIQMDLEMMFDYSELLWSPFRGWAVSVLERTRGRELLGGVLAPKPSPQCRQCWPVWCCRSASSCIELHVQRTFCSIMSGASITHEVIGFDMT